MLLNIKAIKSIGTLLGLLFLYISSSYAASSAIIIVANNPILTEVISSSAEQNLGLGNRDSLAEGRGMLFVYKTPGEKIFWMKRMRFAIDIIWVYQGNIVHIEKNVPPPHLLTSDSQLKTYGHGVTADMVLEVTAGYSDKLTLKTGDPVSIIP